MPQPKVYIVILNYLKWEDTRDCLASVLDSAYENYHVFVIDNCSGNRSLEQLIDWYHPKENASYRLLQKQECNEGIWQSPLPKIVFIQNDSNAGFAAGNNLVLELLQQQEAYAWMLNPDMLIRPDTLTELVNFASQKAPSPAKPVIGAAVHFYKGNRELLFYGGGKVNFHFATVETVRDQAQLPALDYISGACLFTHAHNFGEYGLLPEDYFLYWEETDWCYRAKQKGARLQVCTTAVCYDKISSVIGKSFLAHYYYARNGLLFISKFRKPAIPVVLFFMGIRFLKRIVSGQWGQARGMFRGAIDFLKRK